MKTEGSIFVGLGVFFGVITTIYWFTSYEDAGSTLLLTTIGLGAIPGAWLIWISRRHPPRLEDRYDASIEEGAGRIGSFPESSVWPLGFAGGLSLVALGLVFGIWLALPGLLVMLISMIGAILEGRRGTEPGYPTGDPDGP
ncbi:MAG: cytochrome c oxidase subunit 4 [Actinomycetota bacterium]|nr:cytochrome c oxidase subunit 4 [Actinomycetota bacterium]